MNKGHAENPRLICLSTAGLSFVLLFTSLTPAQTTPPITSSGLNTQVTLSATPSAGKTQYDITGGTRPGGGGNLFHSFGDFNVPNNNIGNFLNDSGLATSNILGRVTGGNLSSIFGTIQTTGFGNANLFLMNPAGFLFGPNATLNVGGMVSFTTADYLRLTDNARFNAVPGPADALLTPAPVAAFGFLGPNPGAITVQGSQFTVTEGTGISLIGEDIKIQNGTLENGTVQSARLSAPGGQIQLTSLASVGEVMMASSEPVPPGGVSLPASGSITISQGSMLDVSGQAGGKILIRSGQLQIDSATLQSNTVLGDGGGIMIASSDMSMKGGLIQTSTAGSGIAGDIAIDTRTLTMSDGAFINSLALPGPGTGHGGNVRVNASESISISGFRPGNSFVGPIPVTNYPTSINTPTFSGGRGGNIDVTTPQLELRRGALQTQTFGPGRAGDIVTTVGRLDATEGAVISSTSFGAGDGGNVTVRATDSVHLLGQNPGIVVQAGFVLMNSPSTINTPARGAGNGGQITISTPVLELQTGTIVAQTSATGRGGTITVNVDELSLTKGAVIQSLTLGNGLGGTVSVNATETISISGRSGVTYSIGPQVFQNIPSTIATSTFGAAPSGNVTISAGNLVISDQGAIAAASRGAGPAGTISISVENALIDGVGSAIATNTAGTGAGGNTTISAQSVTVQNGGTISAATSGPTPSATGGNITINADQVQVNSGGLITAATSGAGTGGSININANNTFSSNAGTVKSTATQATGGDIDIATGNSVTMTNGATFSASSTGAGNAGNIQINAGNQLAMANSTVTTEANQSGGGTIKITTTSSGTVELTNSKISASVLDGNGGGGSVNIDPQFVILQNSQILAQAVQGPGGNINITTNLLLPDSTSLISASSQFGQQGTISIQSPISPASGKIVPLGQKPLVETALLSQRCAALAGGSISSFTVAGRDSLPSEPGGWVSSPLALNISESENGPFREADGMMSDETPLLSVRKIAPSGFLTQAFAVDSSGCQS